MNNFLRYYMLGSLFLVSSALCEDGSADATPESLEKAHHSMMVSATVSVNFVEQIDYLMKILVTKESLKNIGWFGYNINMIDPNTINNTSDIMSTVFNNYQIFLHQAINKSENPFELYSAIPSASECLEKMKTPDGKKSCLLFIEGLQKSANEAINNLKKKSK